MSVGKPILRVGKIKAHGSSSLAAVDGHLSRSRPTANADAGRTRSNRWIVGGPDTLVASVGHIMAKAGIDQAKLRKDATLANDVLLTVSPEWFRPTDPDAAGTWDEAKLEAFQTEATAFLREKFGPRLAAAVLHLDEATPHMQAVVVPVMKKPDGSHRLTSRDYFNPARLSALQDAWQTRLEPHGVGSRQVGSIATHRTVKSYYTALVGAPEVPDLVPPSLPPLRALLPGGGEATAMWQADEVEKTRKRQKPLAAAAAKGMLYKAERRGADTMQRQLGEQAQRIAGLRSALDQVDSDLVLTKTEVAHLRGVSVHEVAQALDYTGEMGKRENAIDLVKRVSGFSFEEATRWLSVSFGPAAAGAAVTQQAASAPLTLEELPLTKADQVKAAAIRKQLDGLSSPTYRVTVMHSRDDGTRYGVNLCRSSADTNEVLWNRNDVILNIPKMTAENARGGNVFITPIDDSMHHVLIDDLSFEELQKFKSDGYTPNVVTETSPGNHQLVLRIQKRFPESSVNEFFKAMNRERGDKKITGLAHPMRLAGYQNRKAKYKNSDGNFPFVKVIEATRGLCRRARAVVTEMALQMQTIPSPDDVNSKL